MKKFIFVFLFVSLLVFVSVAEAADQTVSVFTSTLRYGMKNNVGVVNLQKFLKDQGYFSGPANGNFGPLTFAAVKKFQSANKIIATGLWGPLSRTAANNIINKSKIPTSPLASVGTPATSTVSAPAPAVATTTAPLSITTTSLPSAMAGAAYNTTISASGGDGSYSWWVSDGLLPAGLNLVPTRCTGSSCPRDATIFGTPVSAWTYNFAITVTSGTQVAIQRFALKINPSVAILKLSQTSAINLNNSQTFEIKAFYIPAPNCTLYDPCYTPNATQVKVDWTSSDSNIAAVAYKFYDFTAGVITGGSAGNATITANYTVGSASFGASVPVFVAGIIPASFKISPAAPTVKVGNTITLQTTYISQATCSLATASCSGASSSVVPSMWSSSNNNVATVMVKADDPKTAKVTGISPGVATISATGAYTGISQDILKTSVGLIVTP